VISLRALFASGSDQLRAGDAAIPESFIAGQNAKTDIKKDY
jgi:hypothetical protein